MATARTSLPVFIANVALWAQNRFAIFFAATIPIARRIVASRRTLLDAKAALTLERAQRRTQLAFGRMMAAGCSMLVHFIRPVVRIRFAPLFLVQPAVVLLLWLMFTHWHLPTRIVVLERFRHLGRRKIQQTIGVFLDFRSALHTIVAQWWNTVRIVRVAAVLRRWSAVTAKVWSAQLVFLIGLWFHTAYGDAAIRFAAMCVVSGRATRVAIKWAARLVGAIAARATAQRFAVRWMATDLGMQIWQRFVAVYVVAGGRCGARCGGSVWVVGGVVVMRRVEHRSDGWGVWIGALVALVSVEDKDDIIIIIHSKRLIEGGQTLSWVFDPYLISLVLTYLRRIQRVG